MHEFFLSIRKNKIMLLLILAVAGLVLLNIIIPERSSPELEIPSPADASSPAPTPVSDEDADKIRISEIMAKNRATLRDGDGDFSDWIELENCSEEDVDLGGWSISDKENKPGWVFPDVTLPAGQRLLVYASGKDRADGLHTGFSLSEGESLYLYNKHGCLACTADIFSARADISLCLTGSGELAESLYPTPGFENSASGYDAWQSSLESAYPLVINEVTVANFGSWYGGALGRCDWVEIKNVSDRELLLSDYFLSDDNEDYSLWRFPEISLLPGELLLVCCDDSGQSAGGNYVQAPFSLDSVSETLYLSGPEGLIDYASLRDIPFGGSYGRVPGENGWFFFSEPTPGWGNGAGYRRVSETPRALSPDGVFDGVDALSVEIEGKGTIYYTMGGYLPTSNSAVYTGSLSVDKTCVIRAVAVEEGALPSRPLTLSYIINENHSLPVLSLVSDDAGEFDSMYSNGRKGLELPGSLALYEEEGGFNIPCGIKMHGETSLILPKKNMSVRFRGAYGQERLDYDAFGGGVTEFTHLALRAGQDYYSAIIRNELCENLCLASTDSVVAQRSKYCVLYVNGEYYGIYALLEKVNEQLYASNAGVSRDSVTVIESEVPFDSDLFQDVFRFCFENDMSLSENYEHFCSLMDVDSLIDWLILEGYCANADLTYGNLRYCRSTENDGKWRLMFYDLDSTLLDREQNFYNLLSYYGLQTRQVSRLIAPLLKNEVFVDRLLTRAGELLNSTLTDEKVLAEIERLAAQIEPEVARDYARFGMSLEKWLWNIDYLKDFIVGDSWREHNIDTLCEMFGLTEEQRAEYFGQ